MIITIYLFYIATLKQLLMALYIKNINNNHDPVKTSVNLLEKNLKIYVYKNKFLG